MLENSSKEDDLNDDNEKFKTTEIMKNNGGGGGGRWSGGHGQYNIADNDAEQNLSALSILPSSSSEKGETNQLLRATDGQNLGTIVKTTTTNQNNNNPSSSSLYEQRRKIKRSNQRRKLVEPCGPYNTFYMKILTRTVCLFLAWGLLYTLAKDEMAPGGQLLTLLSLILASHLAGNVVELIGLPPLLGMLLAGVIMRNAGLFDVTEQYRSVIVTTREIALTTILIRAGLELDATLLKRLSLIVLELSFGPCIVEAVAVAFFCTLITNLSFIWGLLLGFVLGAVSPAIVVPSLLTLEQQGYDEDRKISTIVVAAASFDDIVAISGFGVILSIIFNDGDLEMKLLKCPLEITVGLVSGVVWGILSAWIPHKADKHVVSKRIFMIGGGGIFAVLGSKMLEIPGAGTLACITAAFVACLGWKWQGWTQSHNPVADGFAAIWLVLQSALFGLIGAELNLSFQVAEWKMILHSVLVLTGGLVARCVACFLVLLTGNFTFAEMLFVNVAWLPKATVQAALGSVALDYAKNSEQVTNGRFILITAVLSILITAPLGAIGIQTLGPLLLTKNKANRSSPPV